MTTATGGIEVSLVKRSLEGPEEACGDGGVIVRTEDDCFVALIDVLGHGVEAHRVALQAEEFLANNAARELGDLITDLHAHLKGSRGAVVALCRLKLGQPGVAIRRCGQHQHPDIRL